MTKYEEIEMGKKMYHCQENPSCKLYDPETYTGPKITYYTFFNGNVLEMEGMRLPLSSNFIPCDKHLAEVKKLLGEKE